MLQIDQVGRRFGRIVALQDVNLDIARGDFVVLLGPSGCGKSTLLRLIAGLDRPDSGQVRWLNGAPAAGQIGYVFQDPTLMSWATAAENASLPLRLRGADTAPARAMLARMGLAGFANARPAQLSGGMRMRVSIARALAVKPHILLMDEPFAALDEFTRHDLQDHLRLLAAETACTTIFVTHSIYEAAFLATRVVLMSPRPGRVADVFEYPSPVNHRTSAEFDARVKTLSAAAASLTSGPPV